MASFDNTNYVLLTRENALFKQVEVLSNNVANANTPGFKAEKVIFEDYIHKASSKYNIHFNQDVSSIKQLHKNGQIVKTENQFDMALIGKGSYFRIMTPLGERFSKAGNFSLNAQNQLVTSQGYLVLNNGGDNITFPEEASDFIVRENGLITSNGVEVGNVGVAYFENEQMLQNIGNNLYSSLVPAEPANNFKMLQGAIELSNVEPVNEMINLINAQRDVGSITNIINSLDDMEKSAIKVFGKQG